MSNFRKRIAKLIASIVVISLPLITLQSRVDAYQVPPLPENNLINNPWFRNTSEPELSGLDGWTDEAGQNKYWSTSQKESNPSPDVLVNVICDNKPVYCGTSARLKNTLGKSGGVGVPGVDSYLSQVVAANKLNSKLLFFSYWVSHRIDPAEVTIFGSNSSNGPWEFVWRPFYHVQETSDDETDLWVDTGLLEENIAQGYSFYKIEIHARLPEGNAVGFKITGIYFSVQGPGDPIPPLPDEWNFLPIVLSKKSQ